MIPFKKNLVVIMGLLGIWVGNVTLEIDLTYATPLTFSGTTKKSPGFSKSSTLNVFVQKDPKGQGRDALLKEGIERWAKALADRMITLKVSIGDPPKGTTNPITYKWVGDGVLSNGLELGPGKNDGFAQPFVSKDGKSLVGGESIIRNALPAETDKQKDVLRNIGEHELTHILGLGDDSKGAVTKHEQSDAARGLNEEDLKELNNLYGTAKTGGAEKPKGEIQKIAGSASEGFFKYQFDFVPANGEFDPNDPEHVSLITFGIDPQLIQSIDLPSGWIALIPNENISFNDPFFAEGYMLDGAGDPAPWDPAFRPHFVALRHSAAEAQRDGLPFDFDPALSLNTPRFDVTFYTIPGGEAEIEVWAGGELQRVSGPIVPEPLTFLLIGLGFLGGLLRKKMP